MTSMLQHARTGDSNWKLEEGATKVDKTTRTTGRAAVRRLNMLSGGMNKWRVLVEFCREFERLKRGLFVCFASVRKLSMIRTADYF